MSYKRILTIQDISCVGQCSMTVALPILSACGHETCILPTALLSTHTGGFGKPAVVHFHDDLDIIWHHWLDQNIRFDAVLIGYLGSIPAVRSAQRILENLLAPGGVAIVDPAMGDHGKLYSGFDADYVEAMKVLCGKADILLPNLTEAALLTGTAFRQDPDICYASQLLDRLTVPNVILTGIGTSMEETGVLFRQGREVAHYPHKKIGRSFHGTGDIFAASFTGALMCGREIPEAVRIAAEYTCKCIEITNENPAHWYGIKFEKVLPDLIHILNT